MVVMVIYYASMLLVQTLRTTMMAGPRTVGFGCFSPVQRLDERSEASHIIKKTADLCVSC
jgi:hypothetical protein